MSKNPVYGFEKPYLEEIEKEIITKTDVIYYDDFGNLIAEKRPNSTDDSKGSVLFAFCVSDNAFLVNEIQENGNVSVSSLFGTCEEFAGKKAVSQNGKVGFIKLNNKKLECDFGFSDKKTTSRYIKCGDVISLKQNCEQAGECYFSNSPSMLIKNVLIESLGEYYNKKVVFAFLREQKKGAYAVGKNLSCDEAYFFEFDETIKENICFIKKEGSFVSQKENMKLPPCVLKKDISFASQFYFSSATKNTCGIAIKKENIGNGIYKISKNAINELRNFIKG